MALPPTGAEGSWFSLLLEGASVEQLHQHRDRLLASTTPGDREAVEDTYEAAVGLRSLLGKEKRHSEELTVLNDLARRISTLRDMAGVLQEVTAQSRRLLSADLAYIMLTRDDGMLCIEVVDGSIGSTLRGVELAPGEGLGGEVIASGRAMVVEDYLRDTRIPHVPEVDVVAADERLGGIVAVPLRLGDEAIGVLLAADRNPRGFTDHEVTLLASLASHAAIAIHNARVFDRLQESAVVLQESNRRLQRSSEANRAAVDLYHRLTRSLVTGAGPSEVAARLAEVIGGHVQVFDERDREVAAYGSGEKAHLVDVPVLLQDGVVGRLVARRDEAFDDEARVLVESGASAIALSLASERAVAEAERRSRGELLTALLAPDTDERTVERRARAAGIDLATVRAVLVFEHSDSLAATEVANRSAGHLQAWAAEHGGRLVLLVPRHDAAAALRQVTELTEGPLPCLVGGAESRGGQREVRDAYEAARRTVDVLAALGRDAGAALASELGAYRALFSHGGRADVARFVEATLGPVLEHDRRSGRDLAGTLATYLDHSQHHARASAALHIHANTLYGRLDRLTELLGPDWRQPDRVLDLQLALRLHRVAERLAT